MEYLYLRRHGQLPWGYEPDEFDPQLCKPIKSQLDILLQGLKYLEGSSYREVAMWISTKTGRNITAMGLHKIVKRHNGRQYTSPTPEKDHSKEPLNAKGYPKGKPGRPFGSRTARAKLLALRRKRKAARAEKLKNNPVRKKLKRGNPKRRLVPGIEQQAIRERKRLALASDLSAKQGTTECIPISI